MFIFRRISDQDAYLNFLTGNKSFDNLSLDGTLKIYLDQDVLRGGEYYTFILLKEIEGKELKLLGILRYKFIEIDTFRNELNQFKIDKEQQDNLFKWFLGREFSIIYLSRIGVAPKYQDKRVSQILYNFFEFIIKSRFENVFIYIKILKNLTKVIGPTYHIIAEKYDKEWGSYYIAIKIIKSEK